MPRLEGEGEPVEGTPTRGGGAGEAREVRTRQEDDGEATACVELGDPLAVPEAAPRTRLDPDREDARRIAFPGACTDRDRRRSLPGRRDGAKVRRPEGRVSCRKGDRLEEIRLSLSVVSNDEIQAWV